MAPSTNTPGKDLASATPNPAPKGSSPFLKEIYRQFPPPKPSPQVKGSGKAIKKGEATCKGKSPLEVKEQFIGESHLLAEQKKMVDQLPHYESEAGKNTSFVAGQLAALVYESSLGDKKLATYGFQGCIYSLATGLERENAPKK